MEQSTYVCQRRVTSANINVVPGQICVIHTDQKDCVIKLIKFALIILYQIVICNRGHISENSKI